MRRARRGRDAVVDRACGPVQAHRRRPADDRLPLSRAQLFRASAVGGDICRRSIRLVLRLYQLQQREVLHQPGGRGHGLHRIRPTLGAFDFDIGAAYYYYPGEIGPDLSNYWEAHATVSHKLTEKLTLGATLAYAPDVWQTGAWGTYAAGAISLDLPTDLLPSGVGWTLSGDLGRSVFGRTSSAGGVSAGGAGLPLPAYTNWRAGLTFSYNVLKLGLNYTDTTLSKEKCYVMTGDLGALAGGVSTADNPTGLRSALCGATFSATLGFEISPALRGR